MNSKGRKAKKQISIENPVVNLLLKKEIIKKIELIEKDLKSSIWIKLETNGKFAKNDKLSFISDDMLIVGCDIGSETHYIKAIDVRRRELSKVAFEFSNTAEGFMSVKVWMMDLAARNDKKKIVLGLEPTGRYRQEKSKVDCQSCERW